LVTGSSGNVSVRLDDGDLIVTPTLHSLRAINACNLVRTDPSGRPRETGALPTSEMPLHVAAYRARADAAALIHTHPTFCVVWSKSGRLFPQDTVGASETLGPVAWTGYEPPGSDALAHLTARAFERGFNTVLMERHGVSALGEGLEEALVRTDLAEEAAKIAYFSR
jgi:ribulose-5-phosphate 4-epimerase/fuculose-1-phosphate aldolase